MRVGAIPSLAAAHVRLARAAVGIYCGAAAIALVVVVAFLLTELAHEEAQLRQQVLFELDQQERYLDHHLALLTQELRRLGMRPEVDLLDQDLAPEQSLLDLAHQRSTFFNLGIALVGAQDAVQWAEPPTFLPVGTSLGETEWLSAARRSLSTQIVPASPGREGAAPLYVVSPILRERRYQGALVGAVDLSRSSVFALGNSGKLGGSTLLATQRGDVVFPTTAPTFSGEASWRQLFRSEPFTTSVVDVTLAGKPTVAAVSAVSGTALQLVLLVEERELYRDAQARLRSRLLIATLLAALPLLLLIGLLRRSLKTFRATEENAMREERLQRVGEAANLIAHEVKNSLNGIKMAAEMAVGDARGHEPRGQDRKQRALMELRSEIERLTNFTSDLMTFSKGIKPRLTQVDLGTLVSRVASLFEVAAEEASVTMSLELPEQRLQVSGEPRLLHIVLSNLLGNALDSLAARRDRDGEAKRLSVRVRLRGGRAEVEVQDNGEGVSDAMKALLFEPFQSSKASGVGIGLALSRRIALAHGGDLEYVPRTPGASFVISLPQDTGK